MSYLIGMILGNGSIQRGNSTTIITIEIPHKNLYDDEGFNVSVYVKASLLNIFEVIEPLIGVKPIVSETKRASTFSFTKSNKDYTIREILRFTGNGVHHSSMTMSDELFLMSTEERKSLMRGFADVTGYIRKSNKAYGKKGSHRVYIEIPENWQMVIDVANMLKGLDVPVQSIDFGHPNFRDSELKKYSKGKINYWKKEHQIKIWANEFLKIGFNVLHKQQALEKYAYELLKYKSPEKTHRFYWEKQIKRKSKPVHPSEFDESLPEEIRGEHFDSWTDLARKLGYHA